MIVSSLFTLLLATSLAAPSPFPVAEPITEPVSNAQLMVDTRPPPVVPGGGNAPVCDKQKFCGRVYFPKGAVEFPQGTCMQIQNTWTSIWVANCRCTFWLTCTPSQSLWNRAPKDVFLRTMKRCEPERTVAKFGFRPMYMSCSGQNAL